MIKKIIFLIIMTFLAVQPAYAQLIGNIAAITDASEAFYNSSFVKEFEKSIDCLAE